MPDERTVTLYKEGRELKVTPQFFKTNKDNPKMMNGWSAAKPSTKPPSPDGGAAGGAGGSFAPDKPASAMSRFGTGFVQGINPLHSVDGLPSTGNRARDVGEDMLNLREIGAKGQAGDKAGGAGMIAGTIAGLAGPELLKGGVTTIRGMASVASAARAAERAADLQKELKGSIKSARVAAEYTQPIVESVSKQFDRLHTMLDKNTLTHNPKIVQTAKRLEAAAEPAIRKLGEDLLQKTRSLAGGGQTVMEYGTAHGIHKQIQRMMSKLDAYKIGQWESTLRELDSEIEAGKKAVAKAAGLDKEWDKLGEMWKGANDLAKTIASRMESNGGLVGKALEKVGIKEGLPKGAEGAGRELARKAGVSARKLPRPATAASKVAGAVQAGLPTARGARSYAEAPQ